jgi:hypothetical protein
MYDDDEEVEYINVYDSSKYCRTVHGKQQIINIIMVRADTAREYINETFDFAFLKNDYDGESIWITHMDNVLSKSSPYHCSIDAAVDVRTKSPEDDARKLALRFTRCTQYMDHGYTINGFTFPQRVCIPINIDNEGFRVVYKGKWQQRMIQWINVYNSKPENRYHKIELRFKVVWITGVTDGTMTEHSLVSKLADASVLFEKKSGQRR